jgi:hypothetical protein
LRNPFYFDSDRAEQWEERVAIMQHDGGMTRDDAEVAATFDVNSQIQRDREAARVQKVLMFR